MPFRATAAEVLGWRMRALGLTAPLPGSAAGDAPARVAAVASRMLAVQGQDWWGGRAALGLRAADATLQDVHAAFNAGAIVRSWPMRGTLHLLAAEDIGWMQASTNHRVLPGAPKRRATIGLTEANLDRMTELTIAALQGGRARSRAQLSDAWRDGGVAVQGPWRYHVIWWLAQTGVIWFGPTADGGEPLAVLAAEWIPRPRSLDGDEARAEL
ncbi:winged helix DNA-binding domain-containing protein, partial [Leucobacter sp. M11]|nr:winged helix DNA-binding domain-containing protein [Leucobacter sp. M11]